MNKLLITFILLVSFILTSSILYSQCEPLTPEQCPDPENNGQICPDSLEPAFIHVEYSQVATIKPPAVYFLPPDSAEINLHHVKLMEVGNLPDGITWQSNTEDSVFVAGEYYCVLLEGTNHSGGSFPLSIVVDVYVLVFNIPVKVATVVDSTSLTIEVIDNSWIKDNESPSFHAEQNVPNPFSSETRIRFYSEKPGNVTFEVYSLLGEMVYSDQLTASKGENTIVYHGEKLPYGTYFYRLRSDRYQSGGMMVRAK
jgi:hypothetical protein